MPRLTENYCRQEKNETLADIPRYNDGPGQIRVTHVLNPYRCSTERGRSIQQLTYETIRIATRVAAPSVKVRCVCVTTPDEIDIVPPDFIAVGSLTRTVLDVATFIARRAMPLVFDILDGGVAVAEDPPEVTGCEDYIVFSNMDIHLQPHFYLTVLAFIQAGYDIIDVHRRLIPEYVASPGQLPTMFGEQGTQHGGMDCVIFPRGKYRLFVRNHACVGMSLVMKGLIFNCATHAKRFLVLANANLTFHLGNDRAWAIPLFQEYTDFNCLESQAVIRELAKDKFAALRLIAALKAMRMNRQFIATAEGAIGIQHPAPGSGTTLLRKLTGVRTRLARKAIALISRLA